MISALPSFPLCLSLPLLSVDFSYYTHIACHPVSSKKFNYTMQHVAEILKSDACMDMTYSEIDDFMRNSLSGLDSYLGGADVRKTDK